MINLATHERRTVTADAGFKRVMWDMRTTLTDTNTLILPGTPCGSKPPEDLQLVDLYTGKVTSFPLSGRLTGAGHGYTLVVVPFEDAPCVFRYTGEVPEEDGADA